MNNTFVVELLDSEDLEEVTATTFDINEYGDLVFMGDTKWSTHAPVMAYSRGQWRRVYDKGV